MPVNEICFNHYLLEYLLVSDDIKIDMFETKENILNIEFIKVLEVMIDHDNENNYLSPKMRSNIKKLFAFLELYLKKNKDYFKKIKDKYHDYHESGNFYLNQLLIKYDNINDYKNNSCVLWGVKDIENSVRYDFGFLIILFTDKKTYIEKYLPSLLCNQEFIYFAKRLLLQYPEVAYSFKKRIIGILEFNQEFDLKDNDIVLEKYKRLKKSKKYEPFLVIDFIEEYNKIKIENNLIDNKIDVSNQLEFDYIKRYIETLMDSEFSLEMKNSLIDILAKIRFDLDSNSKKECNDLIIKINSKKPSDVDKNTVLSLNHLIERYGLTEYLKIFINREIHSSSLAILTDKKIMDYILGKIEKEDIKDYSECYASINRFIHENKNMFNDPYIYSKIEELLNYVLNLPETLTDIKPYYKVKKTLRKVHKLY